MIIKPILTDVGREALANAKSKGTNLVISHLAVGSGIWQADKTATALKHQIKRINETGYQDLDAAQVRVEFIDDTTDAYVAYEIGLITEDGILFAVYSSNDQNKPVLQKASATPLLQYYNLGFSNTDNIDFVQGQINLPQATEVVKGVAYTATDADMVTGSNDSKIVTPNKLSNNILPIQGLKFPDGYIQKTVSYNLTNPNGTAKNLAPDFDLNDLFTSGIYCGVPKNNPIGDTNPGGEWFNFLVMGNGKDSASQFAIPWSNLGRGVCVRTTQKGKEGWSSWAKLNTQDKIYNSTGCKIDFANNVLNFYYNNKRIAWVGDGDIHLASPDNAITFGDGSSQKTASWRMVAPSGRCLNAANSDANTFNNQAGVYAGTGNGWKNTPKSLGFLIVYPYADNDGCYQEFVSFEDITKTGYRKYSRILARDGKTWSEWQRIDSLLVDANQFCFNTNDWNGHTQTKFHYSWECKNSPSNRVFYNGFTCFVDDNAHKKTFQLIQDDQGRVYSRAQYINSDQTPSEEPYSLWIRNDNTPDAIRSNTLNRTQNADGSLQVDIKVATQAEVNAGNADTFVTAKNLHGSLVGQFQKVLDIENGQPDQDYDIEFTAQSGNLGNCLIMAQASATKGANGTRGAMVQIIDPSGVVRVEHYSYSMEYEQRGSAGHGSATYSVFLGKHTTQTGWKARFTAPPGAARGVSNRKLSVTMVPF
ncbi:phage tail-collar fiber domain-containing protein [Piscirickettsia litoralis]|uniref:Phage tail fibre protein N-terminal domain-containing protein n=1 Tax=Piscirickettsia litoralis TaxID=1891921 RepID=A0ABX2ZY84_9GAMM|nr:phage tail protein [Piscirickettsia litoralis]ODN41160.1 hypothetical protein BGC07_17965 [Piscirickettsia litoralis]